MRHIFFKPIKNYKGQSLIEYLIIVAVVAVGALSVMRVVGHSVNTKFATIAKALGANVEGTIETASITKSHYSKKSMRNFLGGRTEKETENEEK